MHSSSPASPLRRLVPALLVLLAGCGRGGAPAPDTGAAPAAAAPAGATGTTTGGGPITAERLMAHVAVLAADSLEGRRIGTPGGAKARAYLVAQLRAIGLQPVAGSFEMPFEARPPRDTTQLRRGVNVMGMVRGRTTPDRFLVVTAHYDHLGVRDGETYNGADDDASGTAAVVEMARWFAANPPASSILFVLFDGEEGGLLGAREFVRRPPVPAASIVMNVNLDMVGRNARNELYAAGTSHSPYLRPLLDSAARRSAITLKYGHDDPAGPRQDDWTTQSDHGAFHAARIPFVYFGVEDHPDYHKPTDDTERLMPAFYAGAVNTILDAVRVLDRNLSTVAAQRAAR